VSGQLHAPAALPSGKSPRYPFYRRLGGPQSRSGPYRDSNSDPAVVQPVASHYTDNAIPAVTLQNHVRCFILRKKHYIKLLTPQQKAFSCSKEDWLWFVEFLSRALIEHLTDISHLNWISEYFCPPLDGPLYSHIMIKGMNVYTKRFIKLCPCLTYRWPDAHHCFVPWLHL
jgi:hypothetical protein